MAVPGAPPGLPMRASGGKVKAPAYEEWQRKHPVEHMPGKMDGKDIGRGKPITYGKGGKVKRATGGPVEAPHHPKKGLGPITSDKGPMGPNFKAGGHSGKARIRKAAKAEAFSHKVP